MRSRSSVTSTRGVVGGAGRRSGGRQNGLVALHASHGNRAVAQLMHGFGVLRDADDTDARPIAAAPLRGRGEPSSTEVEGGDLSVHGTTTAAYNGGSWSVQGQKVVRSEDCGECAAASPCVHVTGTRVASYRVTTRVSLPAVPAGLSKCEADAVRQFINTTLRAHELEHKRRFETYNGQVSVPVDITACGLAEVTKQIAAEQATEAADRKQAANDLSAEIDPFTVTVPNTCE